VTAEDMLLTQMICALQEAGFLGGQTDTTTRNG